MKKINVKRLHFVRNAWLRPLILAKLCIMFLLCTVAGLSASAQQAITGKVTDAATGEPLIGVTILVKGTTTGALTDLNGNFNIPVASRQPVTLQVSFIGYAAQEVPATPGTNVTVALAMEEKQLQEVVVVGYGTQKKESVVGAITQVSNEALVQAGVANVTNAIAGKLSGVLTIQRSGEPGNNAADIYVRGVSSWNGSQPLVLVDGVERVFSQLDPNEINTISVLKDASATAVFGAKGANGVIVVTTKRGSLGKPKMDFSVSYGLQKATRIPDHIDSYTTMNMLNTAYMNEGGTYFSQLTSQKVLNEYKNPSTPLNALRYPNVNWFDETTKPFAPTTVANLNVSGGTEFAKYFLNLGYNYEGSFFNGVKTGYQDSRFWNRLFQYRINLDFAITQTTSLALNVGGSLNLRNTPGSASWRNLYSTGPARFPAYFPSWVLDEVPDPDYPDASGMRRAQAFGEYTGNPYTSLSNGDFNRDLGSRMFTDLILNQKLDRIAKGLSLNGKVSLSSYYNNRQLELNYDYPDYQLYYDKIADAGTMGTDGTVQCRQTNDEGEFVKWCHDAYDTVDAIVVNPAAWTHYAWAIHDALESLTIPIVEVHLSNVDEREDQSTHHHVACKVASWFRL
jgi:TonB-linked SusC/RagA family outer membrane protein